MDNGALWKTKRSTRRKLVRLVEISRRCASISSLSALRVKENLSEALWKNEESPAQSVQEIYMYIYNFFLPKSRRETYDRMEFQKVDRIE